MRMTLSELNVVSEYDVVIVGAGMVGASAALGFSHIGLKVLLLDAFAFPADMPEYSPSYDARSTALSWGTRDILNRLDVWQQIEKHASPIIDIHVSEKGRLGTTRMNAHEYQQEALGYVVPNQWLGQCLLARTDEADIDFCSPVKVTAIENQHLEGKEEQSGHQLISLSSAQGDEVIKKQVRARLLVIADGTKSETAKLIGIDYSEEAYAQHALIANVSTELPNQGMAYERFTSKGPLALLPLSEHQSALVWTHDEASIASYLEMDDAAFCRALEDAFGLRLGRIEMCGRRNNYPLKLVKAKEQFRPGVLLLGNAAHSLHPVAGQGFNLAIRGVAAFLEWVNDAQVKNIPFEDLRSLRAFCASRVDDQFKTIGLSDQLVKLFGSRSPVLSIGRDLGLIGLDNMPVLKSLFAARAMGLSDRKANFGKPHDER